ncbi:MAG: ABC transporter ATP-binding protein [Alphaproteobacteria bacterium]|nr:ABC transporter ATP-binding protein [Alphaproteobacteria bacterium]
MALADRLETALEARPDEDAPRTLPRNLFRFILTTTGRHQVLLSLLTGVVFLLELAPLEIQRRVVNELTERRDWQVVFWLAAAYGGMALVHGLIKLGLNVYRGWVSESATRDLRRRAHALCGSPSGTRTLPEESGTQVSMVVAEVEPIGGFVGAAISEPLLQAGILVTVLSYMFYLEPWLGLVTLAIFLPHIFVVPLIQKVINRRTHLRVETLRKVSAGIVAAGTEEGEPSQRGERLIQQVFMLNMGIFKLKFSMNFIMNLTHHLQIAGALMFGGWLVLNGRIELGTVVAFISSIGRLNDPWGDLVNYFRDLSSTLVKYRLVADAIERLCANRRD